MCMPDMTENEKDEILAACREMTHLKGYIATIQQRQNAIDLENKHLKEKIKDEIKERKEEIKEMKDLFYDFKKGIENQFSVITNKIEKSIEKVNIKIENMTKGFNKLIIGSMSSIIITIIGGIIMLFIGKINGWF